MPLDKDRLIKLLNMTMSQHDAEALSAIRKSNELLVLNHTSWSDLLSEPSSPGVRPGHDRGTAWMPEQDAVRTRGTEGQIEPARMLLAPLRAAARLYTLYLIPRRAMVTRGIARFTAVFVLLLCFWLSVATILEAFGL